MAYTALVWRRAAKIGKPPSHNGTTYADFNHDVKRSGTPYTPGPAAARV